MRFSSRPGLIGLSDRSIHPQSGTLTFWWVSAIGSPDRSPAIEARLAMHLSCAERPDDWALSNDGRLLAIAYYPSNSVELIDLERREVTLRLPAPEWGGALALSPDSRLLALGGANLAVHAVSTGRLLAGDSQYGNNIDTIRFSPLADLLLTSAYDGKARSYVLPADLDALDALPRPQLLSHGRANVYALAMTPDGRRLVTSSGDQTSTVWMR
jgi:WD40 repeat protein